MVNISKDIIKPRQNRIKIYRSGKAGTVKLLFRLFLFANPLYLPALQKVSANPLRDWLVKIQNVTQITSS
jgi:hypothetical protein